MWLPHSEWASPILSFSAATWMSWHPHNTFCWFEGRRLAKAMWWAVMHRSIYLWWEKPPVAFFFLFTFNKELFPVQEKKLLLQLQCLQHCGWWKLKPPWVLWFGCSSKGLKIRAFQGGCSRIWILIIHDVNSLFKIVKIKNGFPTPNHTCALYMWYQWILMSGKDTISWMDPWTHCIDLHKNISCSCREFRSWICR